MNQTPSLPYEVFCQLARQIRASVRVTKLISFRPAPLLSFWPTLGQPRNNHQSSKPPSDPSASNITNITFIHPSEQDQPNPSQPSPKPVHYYLTPPSYPPTTHPSPISLSSPPESRPSQPTSPPTKPSTLLPTLADSKSQTAARGPKSASEKRCPDGRETGRKSAGIGKQNRLKRDPTARWSGRCRWPASSSCSTSAPSRQVLPVQQVVDPRTLLSGRRLLSHAGLRFAGVGRRS